MWIYIIILAVILIGLLIPMVQERSAWIACAHGGTGLFFTSLLLSLGLPQTGDIAKIIWLETIGFVLFIPAAVTIIYAVIILANTHGALVKTGMMSIVRHPMYFGTAIASFTLILIFQSILSLGLSCVAIVLLWMASKKEDEYNIGLFGDRYRKYMTLVPRWNVFKRLRKE